MTYSNSGKKIRNTYPEKESYVPDQWDSLFESIDVEEDKKEEELEKEKLEQEQKTSAMVREILDSLKSILDKGPGPETSKEIKMLLKKGKQDFSKGDPSIYEQKDDYVKDDVFISEFSGLCEEYEIDKTSYKYFLRYLYPGDASEVVTDMRKYLKEKQDAAPYKPLKKMNYPLAVFVTVLVFGIIVLLGTPPVYAVFPTVLVGVQWYLYRFLYHRYGWAGTLVRITFAVLLALFFYVEKAVPGNVKKDGLFFFLTFYIDFLFIIVWPWFAEIIGKSGRKQAAMRELQDPSGHYKKTFTRRK